MKTNSTSQNTLACIVAGVIGTIVFLRIGRRFLIDFVPFSVLGCISGIYMLCAISYSFIWKKKARQPDFDSQNMLAFWQGAIRYFIAFDLCMFGFQKIFHLQFSIPLGVLDNPFSSLSGEEMIWAFFGWHYAFTVIIAALQIGGSLLLLFRQTRLLGTIVLLPILLNILLLDYFYNLGTVVNSYITLLTLATIYLLLLDYDRLVAFFFKTTGDLPGFGFKSASVKNALRFSVIGIPLLLIALYHFPQYYPEIYGKYEVKSFIINNKPQDQSICRDSVLTKVFIDKTDFVMEFNNYQRRLIGDYKYDPTTKQLSVIWHYPATMHDTLIAKITDGKIAGSKVLKGRIGGNEIIIELNRVKMH